MIQTGQSGHIRLQSTCEVNLTSFLCFTSEPRVFYVASTREENMDMYRVHSLPVHDQWLYKFEFTAYQILPTMNNTIMFIYPASKMGYSIISATLSLKDSRRFPYDFFSTQGENSTTEILELFSSSNTSKISLTNKSDDCCFIVQKASIPVVYLPGKWDDC